MEDHQWKVNGPGKHRDITEVNEMAQFYLDENELQARGAAELPLREMQDRTTFLEKEIKHLNDLLAKGTTYFSNAKLSEAAAEFRKVARDIKRFEEQMFTTGNYTDRNSLNDLTGTEWLRHTKSWFILDGRAADIDGGIENHPGSFPPELATFFIEFFTKRGGMILDPFMGIGSTLAAAASLKRNCIGCELNPQYAKYAQDRGAKVNPGALQLTVHSDDARNIPELWNRERYLPVNLCITSPPYWNMLATSRGGVESTQKQRKKEGLDTVYSTDARDLGNILEYDDYVATLSKIFTDLGSILAEKAYLVIVLQNCRPKDGIMKPLAWDVARALSKTYLLRQEFIWLQDQKFLGIWGYPTTYVSNVHHHYCLVLQKK